jgi:phage gp29-like protein
MCFWPIVFKKGSVKFWLNFTEKFGSAFMVGKLPRNAQDGERAELLDSLEALIQDSVAVIPDDGSVEPVELAGKTASAELYERLVMYCRSEVSIALTGTNQTTEANSNKASASAGLEVADDLRDGDAEIVAAAVNQLIRWTVDMNWAGAVAPVFSFWDQKAQDVLQANRDKSNHDAGARFTPAYFKRAYGYQDGDLVEDGTGIVATPPAVAFAERSTSPDLVDQLAEVTDTPMGELIASIGDMVAAARDLPSLQRTLLASYGNLDTDRLAEIMAAAFALAELKGMAEVRDKAGV